MGLPNLTMGRIPSRGMILPGGMILSALIIAIGMTGTFASNASLATPVRPRYSLPSGERVPSG